MWIHRLINKIFKNNQTQEVKQHEIEEINKGLNLTNNRLEKLEADLGKAIGGYRLALIDQNPDILPDLITGGSIEELDRSLTSAKDLTKRIREKLEQKTAAERIPSGAPARTPLDTSNLSSHEKIVYGLEQK
jgi:hypothetical protein